MIFELNEEQKLFRKRVKEIYKREVAPLVDEYERQETFPVPLFRELGREHLLCLRCPKTHGGPGLDKISECISTEELNRICAGIGASIMVHGGLATDPILRFGSEALKREYLPPAVKGEKIGAFGIQGFSEALRKEVNPLGIKVTLIEPGSVGTDMQPQTPDEQRKLQEKMEMLKSEDIAASILYALTQPKRCDVVVIQIRPHLQSI